MNKAFSPGQDYNVGYAVYDRYDLGEFHQMGRVRTKYGTKQELHSAVNALHKNGIKVIGDIVMNHIMGTDNVENVSYSHAFEYNEHYNYANYIGSGETPAYLHFDFMNSADLAPRGTKYSSFQWRKEHFDGMEFYNHYYIFNGKTPDKVSYFGDLNLPDNKGDTYKFLRSDIILGADFDFEHPEVRNEMISWTKWLIDEVGLDGLRVDAIRHIYSPLLAAI